MAKKKSSTKRTAEKRTANRMAAPTKKRSVKKTAPNGKQVALKKPPSTKKAVARLITAFESALQNGTEEAIHAFLEQHYWILEFAHHDGFVISKYRLADVYVPDFLCVGSDQYTRRLEPLVTFVEIECADPPLFTKSGDPTSFLTHAVRQVQDWQRWVGENKTYLQTQLQKLINNERKVKKRRGEFDRYTREHLSETISYGFKDRYLLIAGRRGSMQVSDRIRLTQMNDDLQDIRIITYDTLIEGLLADLDRFASYRLWPSRPYASPHRLRLIRATAPEADP